MWFSSWLRNRTVSPKSRPARRFRPGLEVLEERAVPATLTVNTTLDVLSQKNSNVLSLRQAIIDANASPKTADTIILPAGNYTLTRAGAGEYNCLTGDLNIKAPLTINGAGAASTVVDAAGLDRVFGVGNYAVTLSGMTIQGGNAVLPGGGSDGGGISNGGTLTVSNCVISGNTAGYYGGGIDNGGSLTVNNSVIANNHVNSGGWGGGIYNTGTLTVSNSTISGNSAPGGPWGAGGLGGGISNGIGTMTVQYSTLSGNSAQSGGAIYFSDTRYYPSMVQTCTIANNTAVSRGGGINTSLGGATLTVQDSTLSGNSAFQGGAFFNLNATLTISNCTLSANSASQGGGIYNNYWLVTVLNSTVSGNSASDSGGGIFNGYEAKLTLTGSTISGNSAANSAGGIFNGLYARLTVSGSTVLNNFAPLGADLYNLGSLFLFDSIIGITGP